MIYLDNAATGGFKPSQVKNAYAYTFENLTANPGRSGHKLSMLSEQFVFSARESLKNLFNAEDVSRVVFTKNCTEALNIALFGTTKRGRIITTVTEHNSVLRPLYEMEKRFGIAVSYAKPSNGKFITADDVKPLITNDTYAVVLNGASNVTGEVNDIYSVGELCKKLNLTFIVDGAQLAGHDKIDMQAENIDVLAVAGHKGLCGIMGSGALLFNEKTEISPLTFGGTGTETFSPQPTCYPEKLESGTLNLPAICSLSEGAYYVYENLSAIKNNSLNATEYLINKLSTIDGVKLYSKSNVCGIVSFAVDGIPSQIITSKLSDKYDIATRGGFHCAPLMHKFLHTDDDGLVRASISQFNTVKELDKLYYAIKEISISH